jgi:hypothetical protein
MAYDKNIVHTLYKRLITFYPRMFREQLGDSMEQTFNDLYNEKQLTKQALLGFVLWTFSEQLSMFGVQFASQLIAFVLFSLPIAAGIIASRPIVKTLQAGGSLFAHPINLIIVAVISVLFAAGVVGLVVDQWPCFIGVPNCD